MKKFDTPEEAQAFVEGQTWTPQKIKRVRKALKKSGWMLPKKAREEVQRILKEKEKDLAEEQEHP